MRSNPGDDVQHHGEEMSPDSHENSGDAPLSSTASPPATSEKHNGSSWFKRAWSGLGLDAITLLLMVKGSLAPTIALAMYQSDAVANHFTTLGYLIAIMSILGFPIMPRAKFIQTMFLNIIGVCMGSAVNLLALYSVVKARQHTTTAGTPPTAYNSSASAVCAVWLVAQIYLVNYLRVARPQFQFPCIIYSIFVSVALTYGVLFPNMTYATSFVKKLLETFLCGFALATGVNFFFIPTSSRKVVFKEMTGYANSLGGIIKASAAYMASLENIDPVATRKQEDGSPKKRSRRHEKKANASGGGPLTTPEALVLKGLVKSTVALHTKLQSDIAPAKREFAFGKLESHDLTEIWKLLRAMFIPVIGVAASMEIIQRKAAEQEWDRPGDTEEEKETRRHRLENLRQLTKIMHQPFAEMSTDIERGLQHFLIVLELVKPPKSKNIDEETPADAFTPGSSSFLNQYREKVANFHKSKQKTVSDWCDDHGIVLPPDFFEDTFVRPERMDPRDEATREKDQRQLFFTLYLEFMLWRASAAVIDLIAYAEKRKGEGAFKKSRLIFPGSRTLYKWVRSVVAGDSTGDTSNDSVELDARGDASISANTAFMKPRDPEHLPPRNTLEKVGDVIRLIPKFFRSDHSAFGFRVACATMTIAIVCYLESTQTWFLKHRLLWAMIMVALSMTRTAGQSTMTFTLRILGTTVAMIGAYVVWYIVVGHTAGVLVFTWLWMTCCFYFILKTPQLIIVAILGMVTTVLIIGYELQVQKIGVAVSESNGQPAYATYILAPYRLATVIAGLLVAFIWTLFPYPVSEATEMRRDLGTALFLTANLYSSMHETIQARVKGNDLDAHVKGSHAYNMQKAHIALFTKLMGLIENLRTNAAFSKFQIRVGGRFPHEEYEGLIETCARVAKYIALITYASRTFSLYEAKIINTEVHEYNSRWSKDFRRLVMESAPTSHRITSTLVLLSSSLNSGRALPPYMEMPEPFRLVQRLNAADPDLLSIRHITQPEYSAFAMVQICSQLISEDIAQLYRHVRTLVGEMNFSMHAAGVDSASKVTVSDASLTEDLTKES